MKITNKNYPYIILILVGVLMFVLGIKNIIIGDYFLASIALVASVVSITINIYIIWNLKK